MQTKVEKAKRKKEMFMRCIQVNFLQYYIQKQIGK